MSRDEESNKVARGRGRPPTVNVVDQLRLPLPSGFKERIRAVLRDDETVVGIIRAAIERELARRERAR